MHRAAVPFALLLSPAFLAAQTTSQSPPSTPSEAPSTVIVQRASHAPDGSVTWTTQQAGAELAQRIAANMLANSCPVALHARQASDAFRREVGSGDAYPKSMAQHLHLTVNSPQGRQIVAATVTVRGFADKARMAPTSPAPDGSDAAKTLDVKFANEPGKQAAAELAVPGLSGVSAIELNSVTYADGSTWKLAAGGVCRSPIDGFLLVGSR